MRKPIGLHFLALALLIEQETPNTIHTSHTTPSWCQSYPTPFAYKSAFRTTLCSSSKHGNLGPQPYQYVSKWLACLNLHHNLPDTFYEKSYDDRLANYTKTKIIQTCTVYGLLPNDIYFGPHTFHLHFVISCPPGRIGIDTWGHLLAYCTWAKNIQTWPYPQNAND